MVLVVLAAVCGAQELVTQEELDGSLERLERRVLELESEKAYISWLLPLAFVLASVLVLFVGVFAVINQRRFNNTLREAKNSADQADTASKNVMKYAIILKDNILIQHKNINIKTQYNEAEFNKINYIGIELCYLMLNAYGLSIPYKIVYLLGYVYFHSGKLDHAETVIKQVLDISPYSFTLLFKIYCKKGDYEAARTILDKTTYSEAEIVQRKHNTYLKENDIANSINMCKVLLTSEYLENIQTNALINTIECVINGYMPDDMIKLRNKDRTSRLPINKYNDFKNDIKWLLEKYLELSGKCFIYNEKSHSSYYMDFFRANEDLSDFIRVVEMP